MAERQSNPATKRSSGRVRRLALHSTVALIALVAALAGVWQIGSTSTRAAGPSLTVNAPGSVRVGEPVPIEVIVKNVDGIAGYEFALAYDTSAAHFQGFDQRENDIRKLGRDVQPLGPIETDSGVTIGAYSCPVDDCGVPVGKKRKEQGGKGKIRLTTASVVPDKAGTLTVNLVNPVFVDASGAQIDIKGKSLSVTVTVTEEQ